MDDKENLDEMARRCKSTNGAPKQKHSAFGRQLFITHIEMDGMTNITVKFSPANTTSVLQPSDQGIIGDLKNQF